MSNELTTTDQSMIPIVQKWQVMRQQATMLLKSGFLPKELKQEEQVIAIMMMSESLKIDAIVGLNSLNVIAGKVTCPPQLMMALVYRSGQLDYMRVTDDGSKCTVKIKRKGEDEHVETFSMEDADKMMTTEWTNGEKKSIPLAKKYNWIQQPKTMRKWRAIAAACRVKFPDVILGMYLTEEIDPDRGYTSDGSQIMVEMPKSIPDQTDQPADETHQTAPSGDLSDGEVRKAFFMEMKKSHNMTPADVLKALSLKEPKKGEAHPLSGHTVDEVINALFPPIEEGNIMDEGESTPDVPKTESSDDDLAF